MNSKNLLVIPLVFLLAACHQVPHDEAVEMVAMGDKKIPVIWPEKITKEKPFRFMDWFEDIELVELETTDLSMIKYVFRQYVGGKYIIISSNECGIIQYDRQGHFVKVLASIGKGPGEVADPNRNIFVDEENDWLYVVDHDIDRKKLLAINIHDASHKYIPFANTGDEYGIRDALVIDSKIFCTTMSVRGQKSDNPLFCQNLDGELLWELKNTHPLGLTDAGLRLVENELYFGYHFAGDTTYRVVEQGIQPVIAVATETPRAYPDEEEGDIYVGGYFINSSIFQGYSTFVGEEKVDETSGYKYHEYTDRVGFIYDMKSGDIYNFGTMENDYLGWNDKFYLSEPVQIFV